MGSGTDLDASYVESEAVEFDIAFLRGLTITPPERIRIVDGIGDSMQPTIHDRDLLFVDINQATLNAQDRIWAIWLFGLGAVKRLRAIDAEKVMVISDNPDVENQVVNRTDIIIHGRVVGSIKRH
ncbi:MAG: S24 family peptidase [Lysobacteraceae bacterium]|nr:MAG: S24 family peptidase [Xanthomonadaceae bacterium]